MKTGTYTTANSTSFDATVLYANGNSWEMSSTTALGTFTGGTFGTSMLSITNVKRCVLCLMVISAQPAVLAVDDLEAGKKLYSQGKFDDAARCFAAKKYIIGIHSTNRVIVVYRSADRLLQ